MARHRDTNKIACNVASSQVGHSQFNNTTTLCICPHAQRLSLSYIGQWPPLNVSVLMPRDCPCHTISKWPSTIEHEISHHLGFLCHPLLGCLGIYASCIPQCPPSWVSLPPTPRLPWHICNLCLSVPTILGFLYYPPLGCLGSQWFFKCLPTLSVQRRY